MSISPVRVVPSETSIDHVQLPNVGASASAVYILTQASANDVQ